MTADSVQQWAQRVEAISHECGRVFRAVAPDVFATLDSASFDRWAGHGLALAQAGWRSWECAAWFFQLTPHLLTRLDVTALIALAEPTRRLVAVSPQAGVELLRGAAHFVERDRQITLPDWVAAGEPLMGLGRSGQVAAAYFEVSPAVLSLTGLSEFRTWCELVQTLGATAEATAVEFTRHSAARLERIPPLSRVKTLHLAHALARQLPSAAEVFKTLPAALFALHPALRDRQLDLALRFAELAPQHLDRLLQAMTRLFQGLPEGEQELLLGQCWRVAMLDAEAGMLLLEHLPEVLRQLTVKDVDAWVGQGLSILRDNRDGGLAYFMLESQACHSQLAALARIVYLPHVQGILRLYASALAGQPLGVRPLAELPLAFRSGRRQFPTTDGETIYLPTSADRFPRRDDNFRLYLIMTAHQSGYLEFDTFAFSYERLASSLAAWGMPHNAPPAGDASAIQPEAWRSDFERFFASFPRSAVARDIFYCLEDGRIDYLLRQAYRGLAPHLERVIREGLQARPALAGRPLWDAVLEVLLHLCSIGSLALKLPRLMLSLARCLRGVASRVRQPQATVYDAAAGTLEVYRLLEQLPNVRVAALGDTAVDGEEVSLADFLSADAAAEAFREMLPPLTASDEVAYQSPDPLPHQGDFQPELVQRKLKVQELSDKLDQLAKTARPISPELLRQLLEQGVEIDIQGTMAQERDETSGFFVSDLEGKGIPERVAAQQTQAGVEPDRLREQLSEELKTFNGGEVVYRYDEWDYLVHDYRPRWCQLREKAVEGEGQGFVADVLRENAALISQIRRQFQLLKPELFKKLKRRDHGEEIDIDAAVEGFVDRRVTGVAPERVYIKRDKREREVSTIFLLDLSASTDDPIEPMPLAVPTVGHLPPRHPRAGVSSMKDDDFYAPPLAVDRQKPPAKRIIDVEKEALVIMAEALESIGDEYAIYGFSGYGRDNVEFFIIKDVDERYSEEVKRRIDALKPYRSTRMGPPIRHAVQKLQRRRARLKTLILLSDGYPQDFDYGKDRRGKDYGVQDTKVALQEARRRGIHTFCITVDREGKAYLPEMCGIDNFIVIEHVAQLPQLLPKIYRGLTT
jgi:nitric oxide reductase NorD protein